MDYKIKNINVFDGVDGDIKNNRTVVVRDGKVGGVFEREPAYASHMEELSLAGIDNPVLIPGMMDAHLHLGYGGFDSREKFQEESFYNSRFVHNGVKTLLSGVTTVRDCGSRLHYDVKYKKALGLQMFPGPRTLVSGQPIIATGGHCPYMGRQADGPYEVRKAVREQLEARVDYIKLMVTGGIVTPTGKLKHAQMTEDEIKSAVEIAHLNGRKVSAHAYGGDGIRDCIRCGVDILDHGIYLTDEAIQIMKEKQTSYVPTLSAIYGIAEHGHEEAVPYDSLAIEKAKDAVKYHFESVRRAKAAGIPIATGTDYKHGELFKELMLLTKAGFSNGGALLCATRDTAKILDLDGQLGTLEPGKIADMAIVSGNPLEDLSVLKSPVIVIQEGRIVCRNGMVAWPKDYVHEAIQ